jgi:DNA-binding Lrp family transcriptional regulator
MRERSAPVLSDMERAIVAYLQRDGRIPFRTLAAELGVTETTVYRRTQQLMDAGYFRILGVVDPLRLGEGHAVLAGIGCDPTMARQVAAALAARPEIRFVALVTGTFDVVCELVTPDRAHLTKMLVEILPAIPGLRTINTSWVLHNYLTNFLWDMPAHGEAHNDPVALPDEIGRDDETDSDAGQPETAQTTDLSRTNGIELDDIDDDVIRLLQEDGRMSYAQIAAALGLTESTARRRTLRLLKSNYVRVVAISNPFLLGFEDVVLIWFKVDLRRVAEVTEALSRLTPVRYLSRTAGAVDLVAEVLFRDHTELFAFLNGPLATIVGIREVLISFELVLYKRAHRRFDGAHHYEGSPSESADE